MPPERDALNAEQPPISIRAGGNTAFKNTSGVSVGLTVESMFFQDDAMGAWWWTNGSDYPYLYGFDPPPGNAGTDIESAWLWYFEGSRNSRVLAILTGLGAGGILFFDP